MKHGGAGEGSRNVPLPLRKEVRRAAGRKLAVAGGVASLRLVGGALISIDSGRSGGPDGERNPRVADPGISEPMNDGRGKEENVKGKRTWSSCGRGWNCWGLGSPETGGAAHLTGRAGGLG